MTTEASPNQLVDSGKTVDVYRHCMSFANESSGFLAETENLRRLGINAQIIAAHAGEGGRAVEVIVVEIGRLSLEIRQTLQDLTRSVSDLSRRAVGTIYIGQRINTYAKAWSRNIATTSHNIYMDTWNALSERLRKEYHMLEHQIHHQESELRALQRNAIQIPMISSLMKIVVTEIGNKGAELHHAALELEKFNRFLTEKIDRMQVLQQESLRQIQLILKGGAN